MYDTNGITVPFRVVTRVIETRRSPLAFSPTAPTPAMHCRRSTIPAPSRRSSAAESAPSPHRPTRPYTNYPHSPRDPIATRPAFPPKPLYSKQPPSDVPRPPSRCRHACASRVERALRTPAALHTHSHVVRPDTVARRIQPTCPVSLLHWNSRQACSNHACKMMRTTRAGRRRCCSLA